MKTTARWCAMVLMLVVAAGCSDKDKKIKGTTPPPGGDDTRQGPTDPITGTPRAQPRKVIKLTQQEKKSLDKALEKYKKTAADADKSGGWTSSQCESMAAAFRAVAGDNPRLFPMAKYNEGVCWMHCNKTSRAGRCYGEALARKPNYAAAKVGLGYIAARKGNRERAFQLFEEAYLMDQGNAEASYNLGVLYRKKMRQGTMSSAERSRIMGLKALGGGDYKVYEGFVNKLAKQGEKLSYKELAIRHLQTVLAVTAGSDEPGARVLNIKAYAMMALVYLDVAKRIKSQLMLAKLVINEADETMKELKGLNCKGKTPTELEKSVAELKNVDGLIELRKEQLVEAMKRFTAAVDCNPDFVEAHMNIGAIALSFRGYKRAQNSFSVVLKHQPKNVDAIMGLGVAYRGMSAEAMADQKDKFIEKAEAQYRRAMAVAGAGSKQYADGLYNLGLLTEDYKISNTDESTIKRLEEAISLYNKFVSHPRANRKARDNALKRIKEANQMINATRQVIKMKAQTAAMEKKTPPETRPTPPREPRTPSTRETPRGGPAAPPRPAKTR